MTTANLKFDVYVFDFDGTIAQSGIGITRSVAYALEKLNRPVPDMSELMRFIGPPLFTAFRDFRGLSEEDSERAVALYRERYGVTGLFEADIYEGVTPILKALKQAGARVCIASGKPEMFLRRIVDHFGLTPWIDAIAGPDPGSHSSDKQAQILAVLPEGCDMRRVCMVGDRKFDVESARALGVYSVAVGYGYGSMEELTACGPDCIAETVADLRAVLLGDLAPAYGKFITCEGTDGCGKSTQMKKLAEFLRSRGYEIVSTREPGGCPISERIRELILSLDSKGMSAECEALLYAAARIEHVRSVILPALKCGKIVLCDRFLDSSIAYQAYGRELGEEFIRQINRKASDEVSPDLTLQFDIARDTAKARMAQGAPLDRLELEREDFFTRVAEGYDRVARSEPGRICRIDSGRTIEEVFEDVLKNITDIL